jgi:fatty acid desaturase
MPTSTLYRSNTRLAGFHLALQANQLFLLPLFLLPFDPRWGWLLLPGVLLTNAWWAFIHEAIHGVMFEDRRTNRLAGRVNAVLYGAPFDLLRWGHLLHHAHSRTERERSEVYVAGRDNRLIATLGYYFRLLGGLYLVELLGGLLVLLPRKMACRVVDRIASPCNVVGELAERLLSAETLRDARLEALAIILVHAAAFALYGEHAWMLVLAVAGRGLLISLVDNAFHYATPLDDIRYARNLELPAALSRLILHFNLHGAHHLRSRVPWQQLPEWHRQSGNGYQGGWFATVFRQLRGPIAAQRLPRGAS